mgnify:CR=1 FL=1
MIIGRNGRLVRVGKGFVRRNARKLEKMTNRGRGWLYNAKDPSSDLTVFVRSEGGFTIFSIMISRIRARIRVDHPSDPRCLGSPLPVVQTSPRIHHNFLDPRADSQFLDFEFEDPRSDVFYHPADPKGLGSSLTVVQTSPRIYLSFVGSEVGFVKWKPWVRMIRARILSGFFGSELRSFRPCIIYRNYNFHQTFSPIFTKFGNTYLTTCSSNLTPHASVIYQKHNIQPIKTHQTCPHFKSRGEVLWSFLHIYTKMTPLGLVCTLNESMCNYKHVFTETHWNIHVVAILYAPWIYIYSYIYICIYMFIYIHLLSFEKNWTESPLKSGLNSLPANPKSWTFNLSNISDNLSKYKT